MIDLAPFVRHMILCEEVVRSPANPLRLDARGLMSYFRSRPPGQFPVLAPRLYVYLEVSGGRGTGELQVEVVYADTGEPAFGSPARRYTFPDDPLRVVPLGFDLRGCVFRRPGLYWVEFRHNGRAIEERPLIVE